MILRKGQIKGLKIMQSIAASLEHNSKKLVQYEYNI